MAREHLTWKPCGRTLVETATGQRIYTSRVGQRNVDLGGAFAPYLWDAVAKELRIADVMLRLRPSDGGIEVWRGGVRRAVLRLHPETLKAGVWTAPTPVVSDFRFREVNTLDPEDYVELQYDLGTPDCELTVRLRAGGSHKLQMAYRLTALTGGEHRVRAEIPTLAEPQLVTSFLRGPEPGSRIIGPNIGAVIGPLFWRWHRTEVADHILETAPDTFRLRMLEGSYTPGAVRWRSPDTLGPTSIADDNDDGDDFTDGGPFRPQGYYATGSLYLDGSSNAWGIGVRWQNIDLNTDTPGVTSIDAGTQLVFTNGGDNNTPNLITANLLAVESNTPAAWTTTAPRNVADWTESVTAITGSTGNQTIAAQSIVNELVITNSYAYTGTQAMNFGVDRTSADNSAYCSFAQDYDGAGGNVETTLAIVYTPTSGGTGWGALLSDYRNRLMVAA